MARPGHIYHWKHGWIPITPRAAMIKAKGRRNLAERIMRERHIPDARKGGDRRTSGPMTHATGDARKGEDRGTFVYKPGTRTRDYPDRPGQGHTAKPDVPAAKPKVAAPKKPAAPKVEPKAPTGESPRDIEATLPAGHVVRDFGAQGQAQYDGKGTLVGTVKVSSYTGHEMFDGSGEYLGAERTAGDAHRALARKHTKALEGASTDEGMRRGMGERHGKDSQEYEDAAKAEGNSIATTVGGRVETSVMKKRAWVPREDGSGRSDYKVVGHFVSGSHYHSEYGGDRSWSPIGHVYEGDDGKWHAVRTTYSPKQGKAKDVELGAHDSRKDAHAALVEKARADHAKVAKAKAAKATKETAAAAAQAEVRRERLAWVKDIAGPGGTKWEHYDIPTTGLHMEGHSMAIGSRVQSAYKAGDGTVVVIESAMDEAQTKEFMRNVTSAVERARPNLGNTPVKVYVPTHNEYMNRNQPGAFVYYGSSTVFVNPKMANGEMWDGYVRSSGGGYFMEAGNKAGKGTARTPLEYTLTHELGHVVDGTNRQTRPMDGSELVKVRNKSTGQDAGMFAKTEVQFSRANNHLLSDYGQENPAESYAEAFAQWSIGGKGHPGADRWAERFGWKESARPALRDEDEARWAARDETLARINEVEKRHLAEAEMTPAERQAAHAARNGISVAQQVRRDADTRSMLDGKLSHREWTARWGDNGSERQYAGARAMDSQTAVGGSPFDSEHSAGLARADANRTKPLSSTVKGAKEALATLPAATQARLTGGRSLDSMTSEELRAILRAAIDYAKSKKG